MKAQDIINEIASKIEELELNFLFTNSNGWKQVEGKGETKNRYYGQYEALVLLYEELTDSTWITDKKYSLIKLH